MIKYEKAPGWMASYNESGINNKTQWRVFRCIDFFANHVSD